MAFTVTNSVATFNGQKSLLSTNNNTPKAVERPTPDVKSSDNVKGKNSPLEHPTPDVKINFSAKGREAAVERSAPDVKINTDHEGRDARLERPAPDVKISDARSEEHTSELQSR